jgi:hypothetical protein
MRSERRYAAAIVDGSPSPLPSPPPRGEGETGGGVFRPSAALSVASSARAYALDDLASCFRSPRRRQWRVENHESHPSPPPPPRRRWTVFSNRRSCRKPVTVSLAVPASAPTIAPTQASKSEIPPQSGFFPKKANPSPTPSPPVSKDSPIILAISAMTVPFQ